MTKSITRRENTKQNPCISHRKRTCQDIENTKSIIQKYKCKSPILNFGHHLDSLKINDLSNCNESVVMKSLKLYEKIGRDCNVSLSCFSETYTTTTERKSSGRNYTLLYLYMYPQVQLYNTFVSYDLLNLISEIGGLLGLTLGLSVVSCFEPIENIIKFIKRYSRRNLLGIGASSMNRGHSCTFGKASIDLPKQI